MHLTRASLYYLANDHRNGLPGALKPIDAAPRDAAAEADFADFELSYPPVGAYRRFSHTGSWAGGR